jgi:hypothetical protein
MKKILLFILPLLLVLSCNNHKATSAGEEIKARSMKIVKTLIGSFVGDFGDNKITVLIIKAQGDTILGRSIVGGNERPFSGTLVEKGDSWQILAKEPGDNPDDGTFDFSVQTDNPDLLTGNWKPYDADKSAKNFRLERKKFVYRTDVGRYPEASQRELKPDDLDNLEKEYLLWMRNEIFARHGYCFRRKDTRDQFEDEDWYVPDNVDVREKLTDIEKKNLALIKRYEKYAEDYGDEYGR